eukprot:scaffold137660_cov22-Tisochrysis_lutea.AAC.2
MLAVQRGYAWSCNSACKKHQASRLKTKRQQMRAVRTLFLLFQGKFAIVIFGSSPIGNPSVAQRQSNFESRKKTPRLRLSAPLPVSPLPAFCNAYATRTAALASGG